MAQTIKVWYDPEGDFLEVLFSNKPGYMRETDNDAVMERVDERGDILGFSILRVSTRTQNEKKFGQWDDLPGGGRARLPPSRPQTRPAQGRTARTIHQFK